MNQPKTAAYWIDKLGLSPHPQGGYSLETYRAAENIRDGVLGQSDDSLCQVFVP